MPDGTLLPERVAIHTSKPKLLLLTVPCLVVIAATVQAEGADRFELAEFSWFRVATVLVALLVTQQLVRMAFEREPVLVFDAQGIHCRRPPIGTIAWSAITGLGAAKATLVRRVLMIAANESRLDEAARTYAQRSTGLGNLMSPQLTRFSAQMPGSMVFHIPINLLAMSTSRIERLAEAFALAYIPEE